MHHHSNDLISTCKELGHQKGHILYSLKLCPIADILLFTTIRRDSQTKLATQFSSPRFQSHIKQLSLAGVRRVLVFTIDFT